ncbi:MAG: hypothetical protein WCT19_00480 [Candidatus Paceibacterota bacterium]
MKCFIPIVSAVIGLSLFYISVGPPIHWKIVGTVLGSATILTWICMEYHRYKRKASGAIRTGPRVDN